MEINTDGKFNMYGEFVAVEGFYNYKFGGLIDKRFKLQPGGTLLWDGDPLAAQLQMDAVYSLNANPSPILESTSYSGRIPTEVLVRLDGELEAPNINFDIAFPNTSSVIQSELQYRLQDPTIRERNAFFLLAQGTFVNDQIGINQQALTGNLFQTASGLLDQVLGESETFDLGLSYEQGFLDPTADVQIENRIGVTVSTQISDRILINGNAVDRHETIGEFRCFVAFATVPAVFTFCHTLVSLDLQTSFTRSVGQSLHFAVEQEATAVEVSFGYASCFRALCDNLTNFGCGLFVVLADEAQILFEGRSRSQGGALDVVDQLDADVLVRTVNRQTYAASVHFAKFVPDAQAAL